MNYMITIFVMVMPIIWILMLAQEELESIDYDKYYDGVVSKLIKVFMPIWLVVGLILTIKVLSKHNIVIIAIIFAITMVVFEESVKAIARFIESKMGDKR